MKREESIRWPDSLWVSSAEPMANLPPVTEDMSTDLLIIGAGYTGLSTAIHSQSVFQKITVVDQAQPGWGCSGRNGGQINPQWKSSLAHLQSQFSVDEFKHFIELLASSATQVFDLIDRYGIECRAQKSGALIPGRGAVSIGYLREWAEYWRSYGLNVALLDHSETASAIGTKVYDACLSIADGGSLQPLSFTRGLLRACQSEGVQLYGDTEAQSISAERGGWVVQTAQGRISCKALVIATNGYTGKLWPGLAQTLLPVASMISATAPLSEETAQAILPGNQSVAEYAGLPFYYRLDELKRLVIGGRGTRTGGIGSLNTTHLHHAAVQLFPSLKEASWEFDWAG